MPQAAAGGGSALPALPARRRRSTRKKSRNAASTAEAASAPACDPATLTIASAPRPTRCDGLAHDSTPPRLANGVSVCQPAMYGVTAASAAAPMRSTCVMTCRARWARSV